MPIAMPFILAMAVTMAWLPLLSRAATRWSFVDLPGERKVHVVPVPRVGGLAVATGIFASAALSIAVDTNDLWFLGAAAVLVVFGALDDRCDLDYRIKFCGQLVAVSLAVFGGHVVVHTVTFADRVSLPYWISYPLTIVFLVGVTNAVNLADGLDGLAGGTTFLCLCAIAMLSSVAHHGTTTALAVACAGAVLGFLRFNTYPASVFMGDAGSQLLGFAIGVLSIRATQNPESQVSTALPVLLLAIPILDTLSVMLQRVGEGRSPFSPDKNHIHHKLLALGFDHHEAVMVIYVAQAMLFVVAYLLRYSTDLLILGCVTLFFAGTIFALQSAARSGWRLRARPVKAVDAPLPRAQSPLSRPSWLPRWSNRVLAAALLAYGSMTVAETDQLASDFRDLEIGLLGVMVVSLAILRAKPLNVVEKGAVYVTVALLVYLDTTVVAHGRWSEALSWAFVGLAGATTAISLRLSADRRFELTPLDLIVLFMVLVVPSLPSTFQLSPGWALGLVKLLILFYSLEMLFSRAERSAAWIRITTACLLVALVMRQYFPL